MKTKVCILVPIVTLLAVCESHAVPFTPTFSDYAFTGTQYNVDTAANAFFSTNYGITIDNAYLYKDSRDTFDGIGVSNGTTANFGTTQTGKINFLDTTDFVSVDYFTILPATYSVFDTTNNLLGSFSAPGGVNSTYLFSFDNIASLTWTSTTGYSSVSGLSYDYDGVTDGTNNDTARVPDGGSTLAMLGLTLSGLFGFIRKQSR